MPTQTQTKNPTDSPTISGLTKTPPPALLPPPEFSFPPVARPTIKRPSPPTTPPQPTPKLPPSAPVASPTFVPVTSPTKPISAPSPSPTIKAPSSEGSGGGPSATCEDRTNALLENHYVAASIIQLNAVASDHTERCITDPEYGGETRRCELDFQTLKEDPNGVVEVICTTLGGKYATVSYRADCFQRLGDEAISDIPILVYADYNVGSCISPICDDSEILPIFEKQLQNSVRGQLESSGSQVCEIVEVQVATAGNIFNREAENTRISNVPDVCQDRTMSMLEDVTLASKLEELNNFASTVPLTERCFRDPTSSISRRCELDYESLEGGDANQAVHQACEAVQGKSISLSFSVVCLPLLDGSRGSIPVLFYIDTNLAACIAPICTEEDTTNFYRSLVKEQIAKKLETGGTQVCDLGSMAVLEPTQDDNIFVRQEDVETAESNEEETASHGTDSFTMMPIPPRRDIDMKNANLVDETKADVLLQNSASQSLRMVSFTATVVSGMLIVTLLTL